MKNNTGSFLLSVISITLITGFSLAFLLQASKLYIKRQQLSKNKEQVARTHSFALDLLSEKFRMKGKVAPAWYIEPYPSPGALAERTSLPSVKVIQVAAPNSIPMVPVTESMTMSDGKKVPITLVLDSSKMASLAEYSTGKLPQFGYFASADLFKLSNVEIASFFAFPKSSWKKNIQVSNQVVLDGLSISKINFLQYVPSLSNPAVVESLLVTIESTVMGQPVRNTANIAVDVPPQPSCTISVAPGTSLPLVPGSRPLFIVSADSLVRTAKLFPTTAQPQTLSLFPQSIRNLGQFVQVAQSNAFTVPMLNGQSWRVTASVEGMDSKTFSCEANFKVEVDCNSPSAVVSNERSGLEWLGNRNTVAIRYEEIRKSGITGKNMPAFCNPWYTACDGINVYGDAISMNKACNILGYSYAVGVSVNSFRSPGDNAIMKWNNTTKMYDMFNARNYNYAAFSVYCYGKLQTSCYTDPRWIFK